jgi:hypothetical protein
MDKGFKSWRVALEQGVLSEEQLLVLREMVAQHQAETIEEAASMLDWQDSVIDPPEHMYGF